MSLKRSMAGVLASSVMACWSAAWAQPANPVAAPVEGERLSDWLLRQPGDPRVYATALLWQVPSAQLAQEELKRELLDWLALSTTAPETARANLSRMIDTLPVTGRVRVPVAEPRWLQAHPKEDPVLKRDHVLVLPQRPATVSIVTNEGNRCTLPHRPGSEARDYLKACDPANINRIDRVWVVQPDGSVRHRGITQWNAEAQDEAAPGALIWAPARDSGWSPQFSALFVKFIATQGYEALLSSTEPASVTPAAATVVAPGERARDPMLTANDWGVIGLLQTPTARMAPMGEGRFHYSRVYPYEKSNVMFQPLDWLEGGFRYTNIVNRFYGPPELSGTQKNKDKSVDFKIRLLMETELLPQIAVGIIDIGGTGLFSSEYVVANKRLGNFDWSLGIGWGNLGTSGNIRNPLGLISKRFDTRPGSTTASGGTLGTSAFFRGNAALFGGVQYHTPWEKWVLKAEYDGNSYQLEPQGNNQPQKSHFNFGAVYRYNASVDFTVGVERGNTMMLGITLHTALNKLNAPKVSDAPTPKVIASAPTVEPIWSGTVGDIVAMSGWNVRQISREGNTLQVAIEGASGAHWNDRIERITAVLHRDAPASVTEFNLIFLEQGIPLSERVILREPWVTPNVQRVAKSDQIEAMADTAPRSALPDAPLWDNKAPRFGYAFIPSLQQTLGGPDAFVLFRAGVSAAFQLKLSMDTSITGAVNLGLLDNYGKFKYTAPSNLPRVRTFAREYSTGAHLTLPNLQITHMGKLDRDQFYSVYAGYLESMYAGVGGEWLHRPWHSDIAFGIDANWVQQRNFRQDFEFDKAGSQTRYRVATGHASVYWDTGWNSTLVTLSAGRYLAKDSGVTVDIGRSFDNGVRLGAWATKTNVSAEKFGEGSFDKGIYLKIPFDVMTTVRGGGVANLAYHPLTRDGGAKLDKGFNLYSVTTARSKRDTSYSPAGLRASALED